MPQPMRLLFALSMLVAVSFAVVPKPAPGLVVAAVADDEDADEELREERDYQRELERLARRDDDRRA